MRFGNRRPRPWTAAESKGVSTHGRGPFSSRPSAQRIQRKRGLKEQRNLKTVKKTDCKTFTFIQRKYSETRSLTEIPPNIIVGYLSHFITEVGKADSGEYEPDSLTNFRNSIQRLLTTVQVLAH